MTDKKQLSDDDMARVEHYLKHPNHQLERKPFRPWLLLFVILLTMTGLSILSYWLAYMHGLV